MASSPPPIIRSSKPFSVEIPQGSNSAKSRRSDIVANDELNVTHKKSGFHESTLGITSGVHNERADTLGQPSFLIDDEDANARLHKEAKDTFENKGSAFDTSKNNDNLQQLHEDPNDSQHALLPESDKLAVAKGPIVKADAFADRFANEEAGHTEPNQVAVESGATPQDNLQALDTDSRKDNQQSIAQKDREKNLQSIEEDKDQQNLQAIKTEQAKDNRQTLQAPVHEAQTENSFSQENKNNSAAIDKESFKDKSVGQANEALHDHQEDVGNSDIANNQPPVSVEYAQDNLQSLPQKKISDNLAEIEQESLKDNIQSVADAPLAKNTQALDDEALSDNPQKIDTPSHPKNQQALEDEALENRTASADKEHLQDHIEALPDTGTSLKEGPKPTTKISSSSANSQATDSYKNTSASTAAEATSKSNTHQAPSVAAAATAARLEQAKKQAEFRGRVQALKKTVSGINHILDELDEKKNPHNP
jgi:hypothetical protein